MHTCKCIHIQTQTHTTILMCKEKLTLKYNQDNYKTLLK